MDGRKEPKDGAFAEEMKSSLRARYAYGIIFLLMNVIAWLVRDYGQKFLLELHYLKSCGSGGLACFRTMGVLGVSLGCFIFFFLMFISTYHTRKLYEARNMWHSGWWVTKFFLLILSMAAPVFLPSSVIQLYGEFARAGAGIFLILQLISVIQFIPWWSNHWMPDGKRKRSCSIGLLMSTVFYAAALCGIVAMFKFYAFGQPLNIFFIAWTLILFVVMMAISLHSKVNRGLLSSGIMGSYVVFLCWSAIRSEPAIQNSEMQRQANHHDWSTILSFLIGICAIVMATFSTGIDSESFQFRKDTMKSEDDVPYKYEFFHLVFSLGAMYFAMLFICWNLEHTSKKWTIDVGWASTWVKIVNEWLAATIYLWLLIYPVVKLVSGRPRVSSRLDVRDKQLTRLPFCILKHRLASIAKCTFSLPPHYCNCNSSVFRHLCNDVLFNFIKDGLAALAAQNSHLLKSTASMDEICSTFFPACTDCLKIFSIASSDDNEMVSSNAMLVSVLVACFLLFPVMASSLDAASVTVTTEPILELYMHDILGGSSPTARPITGLLGSIYNGQVPFARPIGFRTPKGGVAIPNANGVVPTVNGLNGIPLGTGLAGTGFAGGTNVNNNVIGTQLGPDGLGLGFGTITVIDDILSSTLELGSQTIGKAQGVYVASSADGTTQMMTFTAMIEEGEYGDTLNFFGVYKIGSAMSRLSVTGGTGKFENACGFAEVRSLVPPGQVIADGAETLLRITVHLRYHK